MTITEILTACGGARAMSERAAQHFGSKEAARLGPQAVWKWPKSGIPDWHWRWIIAMAAERGVTLTADMLLEANEAARKERAEVSEVA